MARVAHGQCSEVRHFRMTVVTWEYNSLSLIVYKSDQRLSSAVYSSSLSKSDERDWAGPVYS